MKKKDYHTALGICVVGFIIGGLFRAQPGLCILISAVAVVGFLGPLLSRIAVAQERQAKSLENIEYSLEETFFDDEEYLSDSTRIVNALEKIADIELPVPGKTEPEKETP